MLLQLGFPDTKDYVYKSIKSPGLNTSSRSYSSSSSRVAPPKLQGNGWISKDSPPQCIQGDGTKRAYKETASPNYSSIEDPLEGTSTDADILVDMKEAKKWLQESSSGFTEEHYWNYGGSQIFIQYFVLGCQAYRSGHKEAANELLAAVFRMTPTPETLIDGVISNMANARLGEVTQEFYKTKDWKTYHQSLVELQKTYSRGWPQRYALAILAPKVEKRVLGQTPPLPSIEGVTFSPQVKEILVKTGAEIQKFNLAYNRDYYGEDDQSPIWLLNPDTKLNPSDPPFEQLSQLGMDGFIALASLLDDDTLVVIDRGQRYYRSSYSSSYFGSARYSEGELAEQYYASMDRPMTRGEIAMAYVKQILPELISDSYSNDHDFNSDEVKNMAVAFWKAHKDDSQMDLLKFYLASSNSRVVSTVAQNLLKNNTPESFALFEKTILSSSTPSIYADVVKTYVLKRRQSSKEFLEKYKTILISELGPGKAEDYDNNGQYQIRQDGGAEKFIEKLMRFTEDLKPAQLLVRLARADDNTEETLELLGSALEETPIGDLRAKFAYAAAKSDDTKAQKIIIFLYEQDLSAPAKEGQEEVNTKEGFVPEMSKFETQDWLNLLERKTKLPNISGEYDGNNSIADLTSLLLESAAVPDYDDELFYNLYSILGSDAAYELYIARSKARLLGEKLPALPSKDDVPADRLKELIEQIKVAQAAKVLEITDGMTISERLAFADYLEDNDPPESYTATKDYITSLDTSRAPQTEATKKAEATLKTLLYGKKMDAESIKQLMPKLSEHQADLAGYSFTINRSREKLGHTVYIFSSSMMKMRMETLKELDKEVKDKKHSHYVSLLLNPTTDEETNIVLHGATEISKDENDKVVSTIENLNQGYFNGGFTVENLASIEAAEKALDANKDEREVIIKAILEQTEGSIKREMLEKMDLDNLKMIQQQLMDSEF